MNSSGISVTDLAVSYAGDTIFGDINLNIRRGESTAILGTSGRGKSTLLRSLAGLPPKPDRGCVLIDGVAPKEVHKRKEMWFLFQEPVIFPNRTVYEHLELAFQLHDRAVDFARVEEVTKDVGLTSASIKYPHQLSVGMRARLALGMSFCVAPRFLFADEPFSSLDSGYRNALNISLRKLQTASQSTVVWITHEIRDALLFADRIFVLAGKPARIVCDLDMKSTKCSFESETSPGLNQDTERKYEQLIRLIEKDVTLS